MPHDEPNSKQHEVIAELNDRYGVMGWVVQPDLSVKVEMEDGPWKFICIDVNGEAS